VFNSLQINKTKVSEEKQTIRKSFSGLGWPPDLVERSPGSLEASSLQSLPRLSDYQVHKSRPGQS
jgi:hypothetical protein